jgi:SAM-dependent methyltransferase
MSSSKPNSRPIVECQICASPKMRSLLFLGYVPPVNTMPAVGERATEQPAFPLELFRCEDCGLAQIGLEVSPEVLFPYSYPYLSGTTRILRDNFADLYRESSAKLGLRTDDFVIDIGSNDGSLLINFKEAGHRVLGIDPSRAAEVARKRGVETLVDYFGADLARRVKAERGPAKVVTAANVFAHIGNVHGVADGVVELLAPDGVFISESHYLLDLVETLQYDTIYHEHLRYYALGSLEALLARHGLEVFHVKRIPTHGGSIRVYAARAGTRPIDPSVAERRAHERDFGITEGTALVAFRDRVAQSKVALHALIATLKKPGVRIYGIGAPSRASTLICYTGLDDAIVDSVMEVPGSHKLDKFLPGTRIPVLDEAKLYADQPEYALLLSWHIADELVGILRKKGYKGSFIVPLPEPRVIR